MLGVNQPKSQNQQGDKADCVNLTCEVLTSALQVSSFSSSSPRSSTWMHHQQVSCKWPRSNFVTTLRTGGHSIRETRTSWGRATNSSHQGWPKATSYPRPCLETYRRLQPRTEGGQLLLRSITRSSLRREISLEVVDALRLPQSNRDAGRSTTCCRYFGGQRAITQ